MQVRELEKQIGRVRLRSLMLRGPAPLTQGTDSLPFIRHTSEQLIWHSEAPACSDMQRQRSQSDPIIPGPLRRTSPVGREWEQLHGDLQQQSRARRQGSPLEQPKPLRDTQADKRLLDGEATPADTSSQSSGNEQGCPDTAKKVFSRGPTAHARGGSTCLQMDTAMRLQRADGVPEPLQHQSGKLVEDPKHCAAQAGEEGQGKAAVVQGLQAEQLAQAPESAICPTDVAQTSIRQLNECRHKADRVSLSQSLCGSNSGIHLAEAPTTGDELSQISLLEPSSTAGLHQQQETEQKQWGCCRSCLQQDPRH